MHRLTWDVTDAIERRRRLKQRLERMFDVLLTLAAAMILLASTGEIG